MWDTGNHDDTYIQGGTTLKLLGGKTVGSYTTRIFSLDELQRLTFPIMDYNYPTVAPTLAFYDNFTYGNDYGYWEELVNPSYINFSNGRMEMEGDNTTVQTANSMTYDHDWYFKCRIYVTNHSHIRIYANDSPNAYVYFWLDVSTNYSGYTPINSWGIVTAANEKVRVNRGNNAYGITYWSASYFLNKWVWIAIYKNFTSLKFKMWRSYESEPGWWDSFTIPLSEISTTGRIEFNMVDQGYWPQDVLYIDDVYLWNDYSASASDYSFVSVNSSDTTETIEVRSTNNQPMNRDTYVLMSGNYSASTKYTYHYWVETGAFESQSSDWGAWGRSSNFFEYWFDSVTEDEYIVDKPYYTGGNTDIQFVIRRKDGTKYTSTISSADYDAYPCYYNTYKLTFDSYGGFWIYYYLSRNGSNGGSYYLRYYDSTMTKLYERSSTATQGTFLYDMDAIYSSEGYLWYTDRELSTVFKINTDGTILASYLATEDIRGIMALADGGCWFIQGEVLIRLNSSGEKTNELSLPSAIASYIYSDLEDGFWLQDGWNVRHLRSDGTVIFSVEIENLYWITVINSGVITKQHDGSTSVAPKASYIDKNHKAVMRTWNYPRTEGGAQGSFDYSRLGVRSHTFDDTTDDHASHFPISIDSDWNTFADWKQVSLRDYNFTNEQYHQIRFTIRADNSANSPEVFGAYTQRAIEIPNIYPGNYGTYYLKSDASTVSIADVGNYTSKIRAYWFLDA
jgi:hypothetical protein